MVILTGHTAGERQIDLYALLIWFHWKLGLRTPISFFAFIILKKIKN